MPTPSLSPLLDHAAPVSCHRRRAGAAPVVGRGPSITRLFTATFFAVALFGLINQAVAWDSARRTQSAMLELTRRLEALQRFDPTRADRAGRAGAGARRRGERQRHPGRGRTTVILGAMLIVLGLAFWYNRRAWRSRSPGW